MPEPAPLPLFAWADTARQEPGPRQPGLPSGVIWLAAAASLGSLATLAAAPRPRLVWNASASAPLGLYWVAAPTGARGGDLVIAELPAPARRLAARRGYLPARVPAVKRVAAVTGDTVCAVGPVISVNDRRVAERPRRDARGRHLPWWQGCATLGVDQLFLMTVDSPGSFDGRYFGPSGRADVIGKAIPLWLR